MPRKDRGAREDRFSMTRAPPALALLFHACARSLEARERPQNEEKAVHSCARRFSLDDGIYTCFSCAYVLTSRLQLASCIFYTMNEQYVCGFRDRRGGRLINMAAHQITECAFSFL